MRADIVILPGDGIGAEVASAAGKVLEVIAEKNDLELVMTEYIVGGAAIDEFNSALPESTLEACLSADAVLLGAVGGPNGMIRWPK